MDQIDVERSIERGHICFHKRFGVFAFWLPVFIFLRVTLIVGLTGLLIAILGSIYGKMPGAFLWVLLVPFLIGVYYFLKDLKLIEVDLSRGEVLHEYFINLLESKKWIVEKKENLVYASQQDHRLTHHLYILLGKTSVFMCVLCDGPIPFYRVRENQIIDMLNGYSDYMKNIRQG